MKTRTTAAWAFLGLAAQAPACSVCFGDQASPVTQAAGMSILFLLGVISLVLVAIAGFFANFLIRASRSGLMDAPEVPVSSNPTDSPRP